MSIISIAAAVGVNAPNRKQDVLKVQVMLNHFIGNQKLVGINPLTIKPLYKDGVCGEKTCVAISALQFQNGLVSDEHFNGQIRPGGLTIQFINKHAGHIPTPPKSVKDDMHYPGLEKKLEELNLKAEAMDAIREHFSPDAQEEAAMENILVGLLKSEFCPVGDGVGGTIQATASVASNIEKWISFAKDFYAIYQPGLGTTGAMASVGTVGFGFAVLGPFLQFWGFCIALVKARSNGEEYQAIASAAATTAWAYGDVCPSRNNDWWKRKTKFGSLGGYLDEEELSADWDRSTSKTVSGLNKLVTTLASEHGTSSSAARKALKAGMQLMSRQHLFEAVLLCLAKQARADGKEHLVTALKGAAGYKVGTGSGWDDNSSYPLKYR